MKVLFYRFCDNLIFRIFFNKKHKILKKIISSFSHSFFI